MRHRRRRMARARRARVRLRANITEMRLFEVAINLAWSRNPFAPLRADDYVFYAVPTDMFGVQP